MYESISIRATRDEREQIKAYAKMKNKSISALMKDLFFEKIEDEFDLKLIEEYEDNPNPKLYTLEEAKKELGI